MPKKLSQKPPQKKPSQDLAADKADASQDPARAKEIQVGSSPAATAAAAPATAAAKVAPAESLEEQQAKKLCQEFLTFAIKAQLPTQEASSPVANLVKKYNDLCGQMPRSSTKSSKYHPDCKTSIGQMFNLLNINLVKLQKKSPSNLLTLDDVMSLADNLFGAFEFVRNHNLKAINFPENGANKLIFDSLQACLDEISKIEVQDDLLHNLLQFLDKFGFDKIPKPLQNKAVEALNFGAASVLSEGKTLKNIDYYLLNLTSHLMSFVAKDEDDFRACKEALEQCFSLCSEVFSICELDYEKTAQAQRFLDLAFFLAAKEIDPAQKDLYLNNPGVIKAAEIVHQNSTPTISRLQKNVRDAVITEFETLGFEEDKTLSGADRNAVILGFEGDDQNPAITESETDKSLFGDDKKRGKLVSLTNKDGIKINVELEGAFNSVITADIVISVLDLQGDVMETYAIEVDGPWHFSVKSENNLFFENGKTCKRELLAKGLGCTDDNRLVLRCPEGSFEDVERKLLSQFIVEKINPNQVDRGKAQVKKIAAATSEVTKAATSFELQRQKVFAAFTASYPAPTQKAKTPQQWFEYSLTLVKPKTSERTFNLVLDSLSEIPEAELQTLKADKRYLDEVLTRIRSGNSNQWSEILAQNLYVEGFACDEKNKAYFKLAEKPTKEDIINILESCINSRNVSFINPDLLPTIAKVGIKNQEKVYQLIKKTIYYCKNKNDQNSRDILDQMLSHPDLIETILNERPESSNFLLKILLDKLKVKEFADNKDVRAANFATLLQLENDLVKTNPSVQNFLGYCFFTANKKDEAVRLFRLAANQGNAHAQTNLGICYLRGLGVAKDEREAVRLFRLAANQGDAGAQTNLGICYFKGLGVAKDEGEAFQLFRLAANQGNASAQTNLAICYKEGAGVAKDEIEAARLFRLAADQGNAIAQTNLGICYKEGLGVSKDEREAARLFRLAADQGDAIAQTHLGICYKEGAGVAKDEIEAVRLYELAAKQGQAKAMVNLGFYYQNGIVVDKDEEKAFELYKSGAKQGDAEAQVNLGICYENGTGKIAADERRAFKLYELAAKQGDAMGQLYLGHCYSRGIGDTKNPEKAFENYNLAAKQNNASAIHYLGLCYQDGMGVAINEIEAVRLFKLAAGQGDASAQTNMGNRYCLGKGVNIDLEEGVRLYRLAANQGNLFAQTNLGVLHLQGKVDGKKDPETAFNFFKSAHEKGFIQATSYLANCFELGNGVGKDLSEAFKLYKLAENKGDAASRHKLGTFHRDGVLVTKNEKEAVRLFRLAANQGDSCAQTDLGICYEKGVGVPKDEKEAVQLHKLASSQGNPTAQIRLGLCYEKGVGVPKDEKEAARLYELAANQGDSTAQIRLGFCYEEGVGVDQNPAQAVYFYRLAADQGNSTAQIRLGLCYEKGVGVDRDPAQAVRFYRLAADQENPYGLMSLGGFYQVGFGVPNKDIEEAIRLYKLAIPRLELENPNHEQDKKRLKEDLRYLKSFIAQNSQSNENAASAASADEPNPTVASPTGEAAKDRSSSTRKILNFK